MRQWQTFWLKTLLIEPIEAIEKLLTGLSQTQWRFLLGAMLLTCGYIWYRALSGLG